MSTTRTEPNGWTEYRKLILKELEDLNKGHDEFKKEQMLFRLEIMKVREEIASLKVKSGVWGLIGGAIPVMVGLAIWIIKSGG